MLTEELTLEPWCLREFKNRWYLFAHHGGIDGTHMYALDRMISASVGSCKFTLPKKFNAHEMFAGVYGVRLYDDMKCEVIKLKTSPMQAKFFRSLPLHSSQREIETTDEHSVFEYFLTPDYDFKQDVLSFGTAAEILEPEHLRIDLKKIVTELYQTYTK